VSTSTKRAPRAPPAQGRLHPAIRVFSAGSCSALCGDPGDGPLVLVRPQSHIRLFPAVLAGRGRDRRRSPDRGARPDVIPTGSVQRDPDRGRPGRRRVSDRVVRPGFRGRTHRDRSPDRRSGRRGSRLAGIDPRRSAAPRPLADRPRHGVHHSMARIGRRVNTSVMRRGVNTPTRY